MTNEPFEDETVSVKEAADEAEDDAPSRPNRIARLLEALTQFGLGEMTTRIGTNVLAVLVIVAVVLLLRTFYQSVVLGATPAGAGGPERVVTPAISAESIPMSISAELEGIARSAIPHTTIPTRPRLDVVTYEVQPGDTVFGIADKYGLRPQTILWGNPYTLRDDPHRLSVGMELNILPIDGTYYEWQGGETLTGVATFFHVEAEVIVNFPGNYLDPEAIGDLANPNIEPGTWLIIPGGEREFISWSAPIGVTRENPAVARVMGAGACSPVSGGAIGYGVFIWPTNSHFLSGYDYSPDTNHYGIDLHGTLGEGVYASDAGVIVYAGWNDYGYGNLILIDHGNNFQTLYAHLNGINVVCGESVGQGQVIGSLGSTGNSSGPHLHFEIMSSQYGKVNPWNFLPPP
ncbi:MAG: M23 family metallopeptidase [Anaerolineales bacterium]|nr:M23 family metallopeptidase [Anaerolineales bacterium]